MHVLASWGFSQQSCTLEQFRCFPTQASSGGPVTISTMLWLVIEWLGLSLLLRLLIRKTAKNVKRTPIPVQTFPRDRSNFALARRISLSAIAVLPHKEPQMKTHLNDVRVLDHDRGFFIRSALAGLLLLPVAVIVNAQQITGTPGSASATTTLSGEQLPPMPQKFGGKIERNADQSTPYWPARVEPPQGAPNILLIMTDDVGFGAPSTFGGVIRRRRSTGSPRMDCVTLTSIPRRCARRRAPP